MERVLWNTVLGARPLERDGHAFYYADYNQQGHRSYHPDAFPCCSGTLPQVAADYRVNSYLRDREGLYVVLYVNSNVRWDQDGTHVTLTQTHKYPLEGDIRMLVNVSRARAFSIRLRIPAWAQGASLAINGKPTPFNEENGFATIQRRWESGDRIDLHLPMDNRLEVINARHPDTVALLRGPLVLFPVGEQRAPRTRAQLLAARRDGSETWVADGAGETQQFMPFTSIGDREYSTYLTVSA